MLPDRGAAHRDAPDVPTRYLSTQPCLSLKHTSTCTRTGKVLCLRHSGRANGATLFEGRLTKKIRPFSQPLHRKILYLSCIYLGYKTGACSSVSAQSMLTRSKRYSMRRLVGARFIFAARHGVWHTESITSLILNEIRWSGPRVRISAYAPCNIQTQLRDRNCWTQMSRLVGDHAGISPP